MSEEAADEPEPDIFGCCASDCAEEAEADFEAEEPAGRAYVSASEAFEAEPESALAWEEAPEETESELETVPASDTEQEDGEGSPEVSPDEEAAEDAFSAGEHPAAQTVNSTDRKTAKIFFNESPSL
jgi:hypothetical protein